jgi:hypothetical protein
MPWHAEIADRNAGAGQRLKERSRVSTLGTGVWHRNPSSSGWWRRWCESSRLIPGDGYHLGGELRGSSSRALSLWTLGSPRSGTTDSALEAPKRPFKNAQQTHIPVSASENSTS